MLLKQVDKETNDWVWNRVFSLIDINMLIHVIPKNCKAMCLNSINRQQTSIVSNKPVSKHIASGK